MKSVRDLDSPAVTVDLDIMEANIRRLQEQMNRLGLANRPHIKTHKVPALGKLQMQAGAVGITCQKLGEVEVFTEAGVADDVLRDLLGQSGLVYDSNKGRAAVQGDPALRNAIREVIKERAERRRGNRVADLGTGHGFSQQRQGLEQGRAEVRRRVEFRNRPATRDRARDRKSTRLNSSHMSESRMPSSA